MGDKGDKNAARPPEGSLVETRYLIKGPKSAIVPFPGPRSGPKSRTGPGDEEMPLSYTFVSHMYSYQHIYLLTHFFLSLSLFADCYKPYTVLTRFFLGEFTTRVIRNLRSNFIFGFSTLLENIEDAYYAA